MRIRGLLPFEIELCTSSNKEEISFIPKRMCYNNKPPPLPHKVPPSSILLLLLLLVISTLALVVSKVSSSPSPPTESVPPLTWSIVNRTDFSAVTIGEFTFIVGGFLHPAQGGDPVETVSIFSSTTGLYLGDMFNCSLPTPRGGLSTLVVNETFIITVGGVTSLSDGVPLPTVEVLQLSTSSSSSSSSSIPTGTWSTWSPLKEPRISPNLGLLNTEEVVVALGTSSLMTEIISEGPPLPADLPFSCLSFGSVFLSGGGSSTLQSFTMNGTLRWELTDPSFYYTNLAVDSEARLLLTTIAPSSPYLKVNVVAFALDDGSLVWSYQSKVTYDWDTRMVIPAPNSMIACLPSLMRVDSGILAWNFSHAVLPTVALSTTHAYVVTTDTYHLTAVDTTTGLSDWGVPVPYVDQVALVVDSRSNVYIATNTGLVMGVDGVYGVPLWQEEVATISEVGSLLLSIDESLLYIVSNDNLLALDTNTGTKKWGFSSTFTNVFCGMDGNLIAFQKGHIVGLNGKSGDSLWSTQLPVLGLTETITALGIDGSLYLAGVQLEAIGPAAGMGGWNAVQT